MRLQKILAVTILLFLINFCKAQQTELPKIIRAAWLTNVGSKALTSRAEIKKAVTLAKESGLTHLCTVTWNRGYTLYKSGTMKKLFGIEVDPSYGGRDPLQELIEEAHAQGIKVIAWFEFGFSNAYMDTGKYILDKYPNWASRDVDGKILSDNGFTWMNPFNPEVQNFISALVLEVVKKYDVDGVQGDDRLPALPVRGGYDAYTVNLYRQEHSGNYPPSNCNNSDWIEWRCKKLNAYAKQLYADVKTLKPKVLVAHAPSLWPWCKQKYLQDWPVWLKEGYVDVVLPQLYRYKFEDYARIVNETLNTVGQENIPKIFPGIITALADGFLIKDDLLQKCIEYNRSKGIMGESFFYFESLRRSPKFYSETYKKINAAYQ